jgi:hypothetical protein
VGHPRPAGESSGRPESHVQEIKKFIQVKNPIPELNWEDLTGQRVEITVGAWKGERGVVVNFIPENNCWRIRMAGMFPVAWGRDEFKIIV